MKIMKGRVSVLVGVLVVLATPGLAAEQKPVVEELLEVLRENGRITTDQHDTLLDQARREQEEAAEALEAAREAPQPPVSSGDDGGVKVTTGYNGLEVKSADGRFKFGVGGRIQTDVAIYDQDEQPLGDGMEMRRARLKAFGTLFEDWAYKIEANFETDGDADLTDAWIRYNGLKPFYVQVGHQKVPFSQQSMTSSNWQVFQERGLIDAFIDSSQTGRRRMGVTMGAHGNHWNLAGGVFGEGVDDAGAPDENWGAAARFVFAPIVEDDCVLTFGGSAYYRDFRNNGPLSFAARPESHLSGTKLVDTGNLLNVDDMWLYNAETSAVWGPFHAQAEYTGAHVERKGNNDPEFYGFYVQAGYFLTGESRNYDIRSAKYKRIMPKRPFGNHAEGGFGPGAWEIAARYSWLDLADGGVNGGRERNVTVGLNWWINPSLLLRFNYVYANPDDNFAGQNEHVNVFEARAQVVF